VGSSIAVMKLSAAIGPTPGICIKRRHSSWPATNLTTRSCSRQYSFHSAARAFSIASISSAVSASSATATRTACAKPPNAERLQRVPDRVLKIEEFALQIAPVRQQQPQPIARLSVLMWACRYQPVRMICAIPSASALSVLLRCAFSAARTCLVSRHTAGRPSRSSSGCSQGDNEPAS
jgi:hypothetical protein